MSGEPAIRIVVVDDHEMFLQSVVRLLRDEPNIVVVGTALTAAQAVDVVALHRPDVVVLDYHLPDMEAPVAIKALLAVHPEGKIITFSGSERQGAFYASMRAGSSAYVLKTRAIQELRDAIIEVAAGRKVTNHEMGRFPELDELVLHYQPIFALADRRIVGFEALIRWQHPELGLLQPGEFLPLAEETGFITEIDRWARDVAIHQLVQWQQKFPTTPRYWMSVNLSASDLSDPDLLEMISRAVASSGIEPSDLVVEVTESVLLNDSQETMDFLNGLKKLGLGLALDDFGTAFASISYVRRFPFDHLKLDISFTAELPESDRSMLLVKDISRLSKSMAMVGIAEGIERQAQWDALVELGWEFGQGFLFSRPLDAASCEALLGDQLTLQ
jgi:EAL domain-containing protein (putative c-di-GMP-specific phosphodiesterase class I)